MHREQARGPAGQRAGYRVGAGIVHGGEATSSATTPVPRPRPPHTDRRPGRPDSPSPTAPGPANPVARRPGPPDPRPAGVIGRSRRLAPAGPRDRPVAGRLSPGRRPQPDRADRAAAAEQRHLGQLVQHRRVHAEPAQRRRPAPASGPASAPSSIFSATAPTPGQRHRDTRPRRRPWPAGRARRASAGCRRAPVPATSSGWARIASATRALRRARLGGRPAGGTPGRARSATAPNTGAPQPSTPTARDRLAGQVLDRRPAARTCSGCVGLEVAVHRPAVGDAGQQHRRRACRSSSCRPAPGRRRPRSTARAASSPSGSSGGQRSALSVQPARRCSRSRTRAHVDGSPE